MTLFSCRPAGSIDFTNALATSIRIFLYKIESVKRLSFRNGKSSFVEEAIYYFVILNLFTCCSVVLFAYTFHKLQFSIQF